VTQTQPAHEPPLRTLHVNTARTWRGGEQQTLYLAAGLRERGHVAEIVAQPGSPLAERAREKGVPVHEVRMRGEWDLLGAWRVAGVMARGRYDTVQAHTSHAHVVAGLASWMVRRRPKRLVSRRVDFSASRHFLGWLKYRVWYDRYIAVSEAVKRVMIGDGVPAEDIHVVNSTVDLARFEGVEVGDLRAELGLPADAILIVNAAYLVEHKAQKYLVGAMPEVLAAFPNAYCILVGDGELRPDLERQVDELGIRDHVVFTGFRPDALRFIKGADIACTSSQEDGLGNSVQEAMGLRTPIVATNAGGIPEMVADDVNGIVVERRDPHALAEGLIRMLRDRELAARCVAAGRHVVETRFSVPQMVEKTLAVYREVLAGRGAGSKGG
jgi:glycosyltransferase involved in cell wall biosynthesis